MSKLLTTILLIVPVVGIQAATLVIADENFDSAPESDNGLNAGNANVSVTTTAGDPTASGHGNVGSVDIEPGGRWGEVRAQTQNIAIPVQSVPGLDTFTATLDVYIPDATTFTATDRIGIILRWNGSNTNNNRIFQAWDSFAPDTWETITLTGTLPLNGGDGQPLNSVVPIISFDDNPADAAPGIAAHVDNFQLSVTSADDDPNLGAPSGLAFGELIKDEGPFVRILTLSNTGASNLLTITGATLAGANPGTFSLPDGAFPLQIAAGTSETIEVTFAPGGNLGLYEATIDLASNDQNDPSVMVPLTATLIPPFSGGELIINGDFELGGLAAWRDDARFNHVSDPVHAGTGAAEFNLAGGAQWGEARLNTTSPPATLGDSQALEISEEMIGKKYEYSAWYFRPAAGGMAEDDTVRTILRWNKSNASNHTHGTLTVGQMPTDTWVQVTGSGVIPELGGDGLPTTSVMPLWSFQDVGSNAVGGEVMYIDDVSFKIEEPPPPPRVRITDVSLDGENLKISWESEAGTSYRLRSETDLSAPDPATWPVFDTFEDIRATPPINTASIPLSVDSERFFVIEGYPTPPDRIFYDDFENGQGNWTTLVNDASGNTSWELGTPTGSTGPLTGADDSANAWCTNLGDYGTGSDISLRSPAIDLAGFAEPKLSFVAFRDADGFGDTAEVRFLRLDGTQIGPSAPLDMTLFDTEFTTIEIAVDAAAIGETIIIEFNFVSDGSEDTFSGLAIDNVSVISN